MKGLSAEVHVDPRVAELPVSPTLAARARSARRARDGEPVYKLGLGQSPFPVPDVVVEALRANAHQRDYLSVWGHLPLREAIAEYHRRRHDDRRSIIDRGAVRRGDGGTGDGAGGKGATAPAAVIAGFRRAGEQRQRYGRAKQ